MYFQKHICFLFLVTLNGFICKELFEVEKKRSNDIWLPYASSGGVSLVSVRNAFTCKWGISKMFFRHARLNFDLIGTLYGRYSAIYLRKRTRLVKIFV